MSRINLSIKEFQSQFAVKIRKQFPNCPSDMEFQIAEFSCDLHNEQLLNIVKERGLTSEIVESEVHWYVNRFVADYGYFVEMNFSHDEATLRAELDTIKELKKWRSIDNQELLYQHFVAKKLTKSNDPLDPLYQSCLKMDDDVAKTISEALMA